MLRRAYKKQAVDDRERTIEEFLPIIKHLAFKVSRGFDDDGITEDLISSGVLGLLEAMEKFDPSRGIKLNTFAYLRIRGAMIDELRKRDWFPRSARTKAKKLEEVIRKLETELGRYPREEEVAEELKVDLDDYLIMLKDFGSLSILSIEDISEVSGMDRDGIIRYVMEEGASPEKCAEMRELESMLGREIDRLPEKQRLVLSLYYYEDMNMKEIAEVLGITEARISQIHSQAVLSLRTYLKKKVK
ncbi:MAG TPA: FliA/WhiG family RNA polymerase sigma factor [Syntrophorhabdales bacterium]|nr:FliA/WhiG family RNA polymerase sigma factor [Syntrophorhabdales bacterium]